jgi:hypothetical protein
VVQYDATAQIAMGKRVVVALGDGWQAFVDTFPFKGQATFEIHVVNPKGQMVQTLNAAAEISKHLTKDLETALPESVKSAVRALAEKRLTAAGIISQGESLTMKAVVEKVYNKLGMKPPAGSILNARPIVGHGSAGTGTGKGGIFMKTGSGYKLP